MNAKPSEQAELMEDPNALLENALIKEYLKEKGYSHEDLKKLPADLVEKLMKEATQYASLKMEEVEARAHFVKELHDDASSLEK
jgi:predicted transcriptional regulator